MYINPIHISKRLVLGICAFLLAGIGVIVVGQHGSATSVEPHFSVLQRPLHPTDALPREFTELGGYIEIPQPELAHLAGTTATRRVYVVEGRAQQICIVATRGEGATFIGASSCMPKSDFSARPLMMRIINDDQTADVVALVADGAATINQGERVEPASNNVAALSAVHAAAGAVSVRQATITTTLEQSALVGESALRS